MYRETLSQQLVLKKGADQWAFKVIQERCLMGGMNIFTVRGALQAVIPLSIAKIHHP
jgi:hypothetical protein